MTLSSRRKHICYSWRTLMPWLNLNAWQKDTILKEVVSLPPTSYSNNNQSPFRKMLFSLPQSGTHKHSGTPNSYERQNQNKSFVQSSTKKVLLANWEDSAENHTICQKNYHISHTMHHADIAESRKFMVCRYSYGPTYHIFQATNHILTHLVRQIPTHLTRKHPCRRQD